MRPVLLSFAAMALAGFANGDPSDVAGHWLTEAGNAIVTIADCGDATPCGNVTWADLTEAPTDKDVNNPDAALRDRPLIGLQMLWGFSRRNDRWRRGRIYDPEAGKTYGSGIRLTDEGELAVKGCIGPVCRTQIWTPIDASDPRLVQDLPPA
ncbi:MAG: DUF2147 domain-containing protein [Pseudomonadota bacterium]